MFGYPQVEFREAEGFNMQKLPSRGVLQKKCSENMQQIYRRTPMPKCSFNTAAVQLFWNHTSGWVFSCKFTAYFRTPLTRKTSERLLLNTPQVKDSEKEKDYAKLIFWKVSEFVFCISIWFMWYVLESLRETIRKIHF